MGNGNGNFNTNSSNNGNLNGNNGQARARQGVLRVRPSVENAPKGRCAAVMALLSFCPSLSPSLHGFVPSVLVGATVQSTGARCWGAAAASQHTGAY